MHNSNGLPGWQVVVVIDWTFLFADFTTEQHGSASDAHGSYSLDSGHIARSQPY